MEEIKEGYVKDFISGVIVKASPEEIEATQVFSRILVEDYKYPKEYIQTRPQFHVKVRPSDVKKEYPVDIAVFTSKKKDDDSLSIIVECKKKNRKDGKRQLEDYLTLSKADIGVWFNGEEKLYVHKYNTTDGKVIFEEIPNIPKFGQRLEDIGKFLRKDLSPTHNLKSTFKALRGYIAANSTGTNRDEIIAQQLINIVFCKIYDEKFTRADDILQFRAGISESAEDVKSRLEVLFKSVKSKYNEVIEVSDKIALPAGDIKYIVGELQNYSLIDSERDVIADAFETFIDGALKGGEGQFFTPRNVVKLLVEIINPQPNELIIDPACGTGGFLVESLRHIWQILDKQADDYGWNDDALKEEKSSSAIKFIRGIEKDDFLCKVTKAYMAILGDGKGGIFCEDSLEIPENWKPSTRQQIWLEKFDVLLANPPFGKDIKVMGEDKLKQFDLACDWKKVNDEWVKTDKRKTSEVIQILFIERCLKLLKNGGRMGIILPETFFHAPKTSYILQYMLNNNNVTWMIDLPHNTFRPHNNAKCIAIILQKNVQQQEYINMAVAEQIGHDHQGKEMYRWDYTKNKINKNEIWDDIPLLLEEIHNNSCNNFYFKVKSETVIKKKILVPRYFWQNKIEEIRKRAASQNIELVPLKRLIDEKIITTFDGHGSPSADNKGKGEIPYIRVSDIVNWEIYKNPTSKIPLETYMKLKGSKKNICECDIAYVRRGSYRIGSVAMISPYDTKALYTREILILRLAKLDNIYGITPYYLLYLLSHSLTQQQAANKILIETTLPNIADRWSELMLPISKSAEERKKISDKIKSVITKKWEAVKELNELTNELGDLTT